LSIDTPAIYPADGTTTKAVVLRPAVENGDVIAQSKPGSPVVEEDDLHMGMADFLLSSLISPPITLPALLTLQVASHDHGAAANIFTSPTSR